MPLRFTLLRIRRRSAGPGGDLRVRGTSGAVIAQERGATITGRYRLVGVPPGPQILRAERIGLATARLQIKVTADATRR